MNTRTEEIVLKGVNGILSRLWSHSTDQDDRPEPFESIRQAGDYIAVMGENDDLPHSSIEQLGRVFNDQGNLGEGRLMPHDGKVVPIDRLVIDSQETGFESLQLPLEEPLHLRIRIEFNDRAEFGRQLRQNLCLGPPYHHRGTETLREFGEIGRSAQVPSEPVVTSAAISIGKIEPRSPGHSDGASQLRIG